MKCSIKIFLSAILLAGVFSSCVKDKGNYDYKYVQHMEITFAKDSIITANGATLTVTPIFIDTDTGNEVEVNYDDYTCFWESLENGRSYTRERKLVSEKYNLDAPVVLPVKKEYHTITLTAINNKTAQLYNKTLYVRAIGAFASTYAFLTEDASRNVELEFYGWDGDGEVVHITDYLATAGYPHTAGGANAIQFDKFLNRLYIATGSRAAWLTSPDFTFNPLTNDIKEWLIPTTTETFTEMIRLGTTTASSTARTFLCFTAAGEVNVANNTGMQPNIGLRGIAPVSVSPRVAGYNPQTVIMLWDDTNKELTFANMASSGMNTLARSLTAYNTGMSTTARECVFMGGSSEREMIAVLKDVNGDYWRIDAKPDRASIFDNYSAVAMRAPKELLGTAAIGQIDHWFNSPQKGYLYAVVNNSLKTYVESQAGGVTDPGWTSVTVKDKAGETVTFSDPISFVWRANNGDGDLQTCFYVVTYSASKGNSTVYRLQPKEVGSDVELLEKIEGLGNVKKMCYWWG